ncbi:integral membrane sensor signal transduction histidine kinase [Caldicellulosiruptor hydrothermalis 108]|uniref:histidine kinase n=1 Tax=Caldicellulosiruptor hydrothermalis (strain DSM 18901 / VKM B-2411 / 108) TaxID=632292 RepID=E4Q9V2_CALH1|nr:sensor histidine kinase [Caldicellulosiruptor hydrothermalis]ADQ08207.1 integral membrane sensor signal transduction histidine kinase [Caldicellulosiruptor hydrothermalis 108]
MKDHINIIGAYLKRNMLLIIYLLVSSCIFFSISFLYSLPLEPTVYSLVLTYIFAFIIGITDFFSFYKQHITLEKLKRNITIADFSFPIAKDLIEKDYQELIKIINESKIEILTNNEKVYRDMIDYYTAWAHQIKTPIAAIKLVLQAEQSKISSELLEQLFKVEQYVEMVLQYLRMENMSNDLLLKKYSLDHIVKQALRKYSLIFIRKKIKLNYKELNCHVLTDEKWLTFVIEQILSNALKYTNPGGQISIYMENNLPNTLVIEDTGIGIAKEDLPRVFEKGFTGYNGRLDKKSTGIGLYLCKRILDKLSHKIIIESEIGKGTKVKINFDTVDIAPD